MGFLSTSAVTNTGAATTATTAAIAQGATTATAPKTIPAIQGAISKITGVVTTPAANILAAGGSQVSSLTSTLATYIGKGESSLASLFSQGDTAAASGINSLFGDSFSNTVKPGSSTVQTKISDPVSTLASKNSPVASMFTIGSTNGKPTAVTGLGSSVDATGASNLTGTQAASVLQRYNLGSLTDISSSLMGNSKTTAVGSNYASLFSTGGTTVAANAGSSIDSIMSQISGVETAGTATIASVEAIPSTYQTTLKGLGDQLTGGEMTQFYNLYQGFSNGSVLTAVTGATGTATDTLTSTQNVSSTTANALSSAAQAVGCGNGATYASTSENVNAYNVLTYLAAKNGLTGLLTSLSTCPLATATGAQAGLATTFTATSSSNINVAQQLLSQIQTPTTLNTATVTSGIVTNPNLTASDAATATSVLNTLGTTPTQVYSTSMSTDTDAVMDASLMSQTQTPFLDALMDDDVYSTVLNGTTMDVGSDGTLVSI